MKALLLYSFLLLFVAGAVAQSQPKSSSNPENEARNQLAQLVAQGRGADASQQNLCYTMRVYMFERNDGSSSLVGSKTCSPASQFRAIYIPTVMTRPHADRVAGQCPPSGCTTSTEPEKPDKHR
jgi:hypothetical protein